ncbi:Uncharacterised protein [Legionella busanensis]|uniref:Uncharacterized protein n=1 Tax=Legionella busanensis TaxID=190655 RepID=A0A378JKL8_9GAMM|nr:hypothetical protein [Legionella busanensis]STX50863.1 Uncharacterised protein [Legionella busanensis]
MSDFKSKLPSLQELTHMAGKLFKDVKNSISEIIGEYKQNRTDDEQPNNTDNSNSTVSSNDVAAKRSTTSTSTPGDVHHGTINQPNTHTTTSSTSTNSTQPLKSTVEAQTVEPLDELTPTDAGVGYQPTQKKTTKRKPKTTPMEDKLSTKETNKSSTGANSTNVEIDHHVDEQKPLKDDVL